MALSRPATLADYLADLGIMPVPWSVWQVHKPDQIQRHPPNPFTTHRPYLLMAGRTATVLSCVAVLQHPSWDMVLSMIFLSIFRLYGLKLNHSLIMEQYGCFSIVRCEATDCLRTFCLRRWLRSTNPCIKRCCPPGGQGDQIRRPGPRFRQGSLCVSIPMVLYGPQTELRDRGIARSADEELGSDEPCRA